ncbi:toll/interleukin-1 receptor domain-containing protein [Methylobacterium radiotolerans]|uniref:toll/interleukin-1 receptor domain-containing protein n=1 Tax=Methylobacterium radiotolerans TaxID=31998 RepID=UPI000D5D5291|nr:MULTISPECIES: toll/interleukin-1 receptor domain-containing protein [Methylobacterium]MDE3745108.1 toll/interleukin-1 receptor domain-containing protein [Methylobacterium radiotolerans]PVY95451.1 TIR domain-containing protein [Methylobacterium organophilum]
MSIKWLLAAGTGVEHGLPIQNVWLARALGAAIAARGHGLVVGGWHGVDYLVSQEFARTNLETRPRSPLSDTLLQVLPAGSEPVFQGGHVLNVNRGPAEWVEAIRYADGIALIGGLGGTYRTYAHANQERKAVFPIAASGGDAAAVYDEILQRWSSAGVWGVSREAFASVLGRQVESERTARELVDDLLTLFEDHLAFESDLTHRNKVFISYARSDMDWLRSIKTQLGPLPAEGHQFWDDNQIPVGAAFDREVQIALRGAGACLLLVTPAFMASEYIREHELPFLLRARENGFLEIFWIHVKRTRDLGPLASIQAAFDPKFTLDESPPTRQRELVGDIGSRLGDYLRAKAARRRVDQ